MPESFLISCLFDGIADALPDSGDPFLNHPVISNIIKETRDSVFAVPYSNHISEFFVPF